MEGLLFFPFISLLSSLPAFHYLYSEENFAMDIKNNILETIGHTPLIRLNKITKSLPCQVLAKVEYFNPGNSIKDRMALKMLEVAEQEGKIKPGGTIIEGTSGNTGMGLALAACVAGVRRIVYLGGLGDSGEELSAHLRSRHEVGDLLRTSGVPVTEFRASVVIGPGSLSFEMLSISLRPTLT